MGHQSELGAPHTVRGDRVARAVVVVLSWCVNGACRGGYLDKVGRGYLNQNRYTPLKGLG
jgi:hypothetical protein